MSNSECFYKIEFARVFAYFSPSDDKSNREILSDIRESDFPDIAIMRMAVAYFLNSYPDFSQ